MAALGHHASPGWKINLAAFGSVGGGSVRQPTLTVRIVVGLTFGRRQQPLNVADSKIADSSIAIRFADLVIDPPAFAGVGDLEVLASGVGGGEILARLLEQRPQPIPVARQHAVVAAELPVADCEGEGDAGERERRDAEPDNGTDHEPNRTESRTS